MRSVLNRFQNLWTRSHLGWALVLAILIFLLLPPSLGVRARLLAAWTISVGYFLTLLIGIMRKATAEQTRDRCQRQPVNSAIIIVLVTTVLCISLFAVGFLLSTAKDMPPLIQMLHVGLSVLSILSAWFLNHVTFAQQYAALYYQPKTSNLPTGLDSTADAPHSEHPWAGGLLFQKEEFPNYWDFLYFAFIIGATAQTADTFILSRPIRRLALVQALVAFLFFVGILGLCVNIGSSLLQSGNG